MGRADVLKARYEQQSRKMGGAPGGTGGSPGRYRASRRSSRSKWPVAVVLLLLVAGGWFGLSRGCGSGNLMQSSSAYDLMGTGTGFFISEDGWFITAAHVVAGSREIQLIIRGDAVPARLVRIDHANDVALLKADGQFAALPIAVQTDLRLGDSVFTIGFPMPGIQGQSPKLTRGDISSMAGLQDDPRHFQISAPVQPGNSGGPLCSADGTVQGVIVARINDQFVMQSSGVVPQNVNYALKMAYLLPLLAPEPGVSALRVSPRVGSTTPAEAVEAAVAIVASFGG